MPHLHEKIDMTVDVLIVFKNKVLLRRHDKYNVWLPVGGHIELDEDPNQAAIREVKEEVGLDITLYRQIDGPMPLSANYTELIPPQFLNRHRINENHEHVDLIYFASSNSDRIIEGETEKSNGVKWFSKEELDQNDDGISPNIIFYAQKALAVLGNEK